MVTGATDINADRGCSRDVDPDMAHFPNVGLNNKIIPGGITSHPGLYGPDGTLTF